MSVLVVNGDSRPLLLGETVADVVAGLLGAASSGVAVAVDGQVVRRADWASTVLTDGTRVEVLTAMQGG